MPWNYDLWLEQPYQRPYYDPDEEGREADEADRRYAEMKDERVGD